MTMQLVALVRTIRTAGVKILARKLQVRKADPVPSLKLEHTQPQERGQGSAFLTCKLAMLDHFRRHGFEVVRDRAMDKQKLLKQLDKTWAVFKESYAGLSDSELTEPGVTGNWSVKDIIAHVTWWEEEALKHLPLIIQGGRPPRYSTQYGGINAFNALMTEQKRGMSLGEVLEQQEETHRRLIAYIESVPEEQFTAEMRVRRRLRLDTYSHYPKHAQAIRAWRERLG